MRENEELRRVLEAVEELQPKRPLGCGPHKEDFAPEVWDRMVAGGEHRVALGEDDEVSQ